MNSLSQQLQAWLGPNAKAIRALIAPLRAESLRIDGAFHKINAELNILTTSLRANASLTVIALGTSFRSVMKPIDFVQLSGSSAPSPLATWIRPAHASMVAARIAVWDRST